MTIHTSDIPESEWQVESVVESVYVVRKLQRPEMVDRKTRGIQSKPDEHPGSILVHYTHLLDLMVSLLRAIWCFSLIDAYRVNPECAHLEATSQVENGIVAIRGDEERAPITSYWSVAFECAPDIRQSFVLIARLLEGHLADAALHRGVPFSGW
jgi:hypothetical protein